MLCAGEVWQLMLGKSLRGVLVALVALSLAAPVTAVWGVDAATVSVSNLPVINGVVGTTYTPIVTTTGDGTTSVTVGGTGLMTKFSHAKKCAARDSNPEPAD